MKTVYILALFISLCEAKDWCTEDTLDVLVSGYSGYTVGECDKDTQCKETMGGLIFISFIIFCIFHCCGCLSTENNRRYERDEARDNREHQDQVDALGDIAFLLGLLVADD
jgi:hypothetical protein